MMTSRKSNANTKKTFHSRKTFTKAYILIKILNELKEVNEDVDIWYRDKFYNQPSDSIPLILYRWLDERINDRICQDYINVYVDFAMEYGIGTDRFKTMWKGYYVKMLKDTSIEKRFMDEFMNINLI